MIQISFTFREDDDYQMRGRKPERYKRRTFFDDIVDIYNRASIANG